MNNKDLQHCKTLQRVQETCDGNYLRGSPKSRLRKKALSKLAP